MARAPTTAHAIIHAERELWLNAGPETYAALQPEAEALLSETIEYAGQWNGFKSTADLQGAPVSDPARTKTPLQDCLALGKFWEVDYLLLKIEADNEIRLRGGCLCFPSSWRLTDKIGHPIEFIHGPVPGLNASIGAGIHKFLANLKPGAASLRHNWGLSRSPELNHHPDRKLPRLDADVRQDEVWLRVEYQALVAMPKSGGILFGIRVVNHALSEVKADALATPRLIKALETMPEPLAQYKGIATARRRVIELLRGP